LSEPSSPQLERVDGSRRGTLARALSDFTFMPTVGVRLQDAASTRSPSISTMQARQLPSGR